MKPTGVLAVNIIGAKNLAKEGGFLKKLTWTDSPDVFVRFKMGNEMFETNHVRDSENPTFKKIWYLTFPPYFTQIHDRNHCNFQARISHGC